VVVHLPTALADPLGVHPPAAALRRIAGESGFYQRLQRGFTRYTNSWASWLQTITGAHASYLAQGLPSIGIPHLDTTIVFGQPIIDTTYDMSPQKGSNLQVGPDVTINIATQKLGCFKSISITRRCQYPK